MRDVDIDDLIQRTREGTKYHTDTLGELLMMAAEDGLLGWVDFRDCINRLNDIQVRVNAACTRLDKMRKL